MKFLIDQDVYAVTARFLNGLGHEVIQAAQAGLSRAGDEQLLEFAQEQRLILVTRDRDFGALVFAKGLGSGVLYLRMLPSTQDAVHGELEKILNIYPEQDLMKSFVVVEPDGYRIRRLPIE